MIALTDNQRAEFFRRSYTALDGLWFMKVEERYGFEVALEVDNEVWKVVPKIQARQLKSMANLGGGIDALLECFTTKLALENFKFEVEKGESGFKVLIKECPWHNLMVKSNREELSEKVGTLICNTEGSVWASEFGEKISFELKGQICKGENFCTLKFTEYCNYDKDGGEPL